MTQKNIAVVGGGYSGEYGISVRSANIVCGHLDTRKYRPYLIIITRDGWVHTDEKGRSHPVNLDDFSLFTGKRKVSFDAVFIAIHGTPGEDGKLQGYFDMLGIPYTSCSQGVSSLTFNKYYCNAVVAGLGVRTAANMLLYKGQMVDAEQIARQIGFPCFVKPNNGGSSVGMSKVVDLKALAPAIKKAFREDEQVLVEQFVSGTEITCGLMRYHGRMIVFPITEIVSKKEFFDFEAKYNPGLSEEITPARITSEVAEACMATSNVIYQRLGCTGVVRMDYIASDRGLFFLEVNTVPGMTDVSIVPKQAGVFGISITKLFDMLLSECLGSARKK